mmetsp:Transcript_19112/g.26843  ORF Transcript_19112/g.26843 Transcript_19112/m.26843 type:complete len:203 (-) Transcript_19112:136-744(-)
MTRRSNTKSSNNKKHSTSKTMTMRKTALLVVMTLMTAPEDHTGSAFVQQSNGLHAAKTALHSSASDGGGGGAMGLPPDLQRAYERKNATRKKFGLKPMPIQEFLDLQTQVAQMEQEQAMKYQEQQRMTSQQQQQKQQQGLGLGNFAKNLFEKATEDTCISNFDCESPKVCCDLGVKKMCCSNGMLQVQHEYAFEPIPVDMRD